MTTIMRAILICVAAGAITVAAVDGAPAQVGEEPQGALSAELVTSVPASGSIAVQYRDDTELNRQLAAVIEAKLTALGYAAAPEADMVLTFETEVDAQSSGGSNIGVAGRGGSGNRQAFDLRLRVPLGEERRPSARTQFRLSLTLTRAGEPPLWGGMALAVVPKTDWLPIQSLLADRLLNNLGKTVENQPIFIR